MESYKGELVTTQLGVASGFKKVEGIYIYRLMVYMNRRLMPIIVLKVLDPILFACHFGPATISTRVQAQALFLAHILGLSR